MKRLTTESWDPDYDDKPVNQFGEKWQKISGTWLNSAIDHVIKDVQIDPFEDGPKIESLSLGSLHLCEGGYLIATIYGGANGGGFRGVESNWKYYLSLVRKFLGKLLDYSNGRFFKDVWMIDWDNDCCDDVWTLRLGLELGDDEKLSLIECIDSFPILNPEKMHIEIDATPSMPDQMPVVQNVNPSIPQVGESSGRHGKGMTWRRI